MKDLLMCFLLVCCVQLQCAEPLKSWQQRFALFIVSKDRFAQVQNGSEEISAGKLGDNKPVPKRFEKSNRKKLITDERVLAFAVSAWYE
ncbi:MAG TPA: hypothetical protein VHO47_00210 [Candidatus Babeliales bacterium]|nr:hypothetical protein [Candidatus Babeliales bacterium]